MRIKKCLSVFLVCVLLVSFSACGAVGGDAIVSDNVPTSSSDIAEKTEANESAGYTVPSVPNVDASSYAYTYEEAVQNLEDFINGDVEKMLVNIPKNQLEKSAYFHWAQETVGGNPIYAQYEEYTEDCYKLYIAECIDSMRERYISDKEYEEQSMGENLHRTLTIKNALVLEEGMEKFDDLLRFGSIEEAYMVKCSIKMSGDAHTVEGDYDNLYTIKMDGIWYPVYLRYGQFGGKLEKAAYFDDAYGIF